MIPNMMRAIAVTEPGGPEVMVVGEQPVPQLNGGELLVKVAAAGVNRADCMQRRGDYPPPPGASEILGLEVSGTVAALGEGVSGWQVGDPVCALLAGGGYAEYCAVPAPQCLPVPAGVDLVDAAALPEVALTVWTNVFERGGLMPGETLLVHGGSSGIGTMAIQLASALGATVFVTAGSIEKCDACEALGAAHAFNYREVDFVEAVRSVAGGVDVVLDMVGGPYLDSNLNLLNLDGRLVIIALMGGAQAEINLATLMRRRLIVTGTTLRARTIEQKGAVVDAVRARVWPLVESGRVRPVIHRRWLWSEAADAHRVMEASTHIGKLLLVF
jgi:putative PIG3 family NAD(P)H quinone oxidoreductase